MVACLKKDNSDQGNSRKALFRYLRFAVGITILFFIIRHIDFNKFLESMLKTNPWLMIIGLSHFPLLIFLAILRWRSLLLQYQPDSIPICLVARHYWIGLTLGFFSPASLGLDIYRVVVISRRFGQYMINIAIVFIEKFMALISCLAIIAFLYPLLPINLSPQVEQIHYLSQQILVILVLLSGIMIIVLRYHVVTGLLDIINTYIAKLFTRISRKFAPHNEQETKHFLFTEACKPFLSPVNLAIVFIISFGIQLVSAVKSQIFFSALNFDLPFIVNMFITPALYFIFTLPISLGSLGIREGAYIILYGLFGVPAEVALLISFFNLSGILLNNLIGGIVLLITKTDTEIIN